jgi:outer membrane murein-binding lipoprotein Lpp
VRCIEARLGAAVVGLVLIAGCSSGPPAPPPAAAPNAASTSVAAAGRLPSPSAVRSWNDVRAQAARRLMAANPGITYEGAVPDPLLAIPVLEIELNSDGSIRNIDVMRVPRQAKDTVQIAIDAVRRAAPFGDVSKLPKPWKFSETFLFNDDRKFKPRTLDP